MTFNPVNTLSDAFIVRRIRNECRTFLTNNTDYIGIPRQIYWYFTYYQHASYERVYRIYITRDSKNKPVGYGALHLTSGKLFVTECVAKKYRGQGWGHTILKKLINIGEREKLPLIAEIRQTNKISISLHKKSGFTLESTKLKSGHKLCVYKKI
jgi:RimJ/RimL family protein N-acetyltransferase